jgi:1,4-dihydroxy-2-naphthoate octaprenyltransferase
MADGTADASGVNLSRAAAWTIAARPRTLPAAVAPVLVGSALAQFDGVFRWDSFALALVGALAIQVAANFANDASDAKRGADAERVGPPRMVTAGVISSRQMWTGVAIAVAVSAATGVWLFSIAGWPILVIGAVSVLAMLTYVGGPIPYGYRGLGEVMVFVFFGFVATVGTRFAHDGNAGLSAWVLGAVMGSLAAAILMANNLRDLETDARAGKRTLAVMIGPDRARRLYSILLIGPFALIAVAAGLGWIPILAGISVVLLPLSRPLIAGVYREASAEALIGVLAGTARLQLLVAIGLAAGALAT